MGPELGRVAEGAGGDEVADAGEGGRVTDAGDGGSGTDASVPTFAFDPPAVVEELYSGSKDDNPTLTSDMTEIWTLPVVALVARAGA